MASRLFMSAQRRTSFLLSNSLLPLDSQNLGKFGWVESLKFSDVSSLEDPCFTGILEGKDDCSAVDHEYPGDLVT